MDPSPDAAIAALKTRGLSSLPPLAIVLGSGLGAFTDEAREAISVSYLDIPGFPIPTVEGHAGRLVVGAIEGRRVALFQGRGHYYERGDANAMRVAIDAFRKLGGEALLLTNAAGGLNTDGRALAGRDHRSHQFFRDQSADRPYRPRPFRAADARLRRSAAGEPARSGASDGRYPQRWRLHVVLRPEFRDAGRDLRREILGADLVGMSTVPEVILARRAGLRCAAVSVVTNYAAGLAGGDPSHEETQAVAHEAADRFKRLLRAFIRQYETKRGCFSTRHAKGELGRSMASRYAGREGMEPKAAAVKA